ncbi:MAG: hypothetical protein HYU64_19235 [Armatimonadetes bacterium]|nr:hypothetical protein [Armatimonadota bacterium]
MDENKFFLIDRLSRDHEIVYGKKPRVTADFEEVRKALVAKNPLVPVEILWPLREGGFAHQVILFRSLDADNRVGFTPPSRSKTLPYAFPPFWEEEPALIPARNLSVLFSDDRARALLA